MAGRVAPFIDNTGLVFAYDQANIVRSYLGEPTVNIATNTPSLGGWPGSYTVVDSDTKTFDFTTSTVEWGGDASWTTFYYNVSAYTGQYVTISATFEYASDPNKFNFLWIGQTSGSETYLGYSSEADRNQKSTDDREDISWSGVIGSGGKVGILIWMSNGNSTTVTARISNIQVEVKSHKTPFTTGTRSVTQGLKDLTGRSTIDLTNVSFDSNAQMTFDGTDDYAALSGFVQPSNPNNFSVEAVVKLSSHNAGTNIGSVIVNNYSSLRGWIFFLNGPSSFLGLRHHNESNPGGYNVVYGTGINLNQWYHIAATDDGTTVRLYINGVQVTSGSSGPSINFAGQPIIGQFGGGNAVTNGSIPYVRIFDRALPASEIQQNFNAIKGRYGL